jgi:hypothetical protein
MPSASIVMYIAPDNQNSRDDQRCKDDARAWNSKAGDHGRQEQDEIRTPRMRG